MMYMYNGDIDKNITKTLDQNSSLLILTLDNCSYIII